MLNNGIYENRQSLPVGPSDSSFNRKNSAQVSRTKGNDILTDGGLRALNKIENTPLQSQGKALDLNSSNHNTQPQSLVALPTVNRSNNCSVDRDAADKFKSISTCSNYDTVAAPIGDKNRRKNPFKLNPASNSCIFGSQNNINQKDFTDSVISNNECGGNQKALSKSNVFLRAARSITKTKSVSGSFIVKTTICRSINSRALAAAEDSRDEPCGVDAS